VGGAPVSNYFAREIGAYGFATVEYSATVICKILIS